MKNKYLECKAHDSTFIATDSTLLPMLKSLLQSELEVYKIQRCNKKGWHIFVDLKEKPKRMFPMAKKEIKKKKGRKRTGIWTQKEVSYLRENYGKLTYRAIANVLNRTPKSVMNKAFNLKLLKLPKKPKRRSIIKGWRWSESEDAYLKKNYKKMYAEDIATELGRTADAIRSRANQFGLVGVHRRGKRR